MLEEFIAVYRDAIIERARQKLTARPWPSVSLQELDNGVPLFLTQLSEALRAESSGAPYSSREIGSTAARHGGELLALGFTVSQVVHDYGDICQAITETAIEHNAPPDWVFVREVTLHKRIADDEHFRRIGGVLVREHATALQRDVHRAEIVVAGNCVISSRFVTRFVWLAPLDLKTQLNVEIGEGNIADDRNITNTRKRFHSADKLFECRGTLLRRGVFRPAQRNVKREQDPHHAEKRERARKEGDDAVGDKRVERLNVVGEP